jgi:hypothetical protein
MARLCRLSIMTHSSFFRGFLLPTCYQRQGRYINRPFCQIMGKTFSPSEGILPPIGFQPPRTFSFVFFVHFVVNLFR